MSAHSAGDRVGRVEGAEADDGGIVGGARVGGTLASDGGVPPPLVPPTGAAVLGPGVSVGVGTDGQCRIAVRYSPVERGCAGYELYPESSTSSSGWVPSTPLAPSGTFSAKATWVLPPRLRHSMYAVNGGRWQPRSTV